MNRLILGAIGAFGLSMAATGVMAQESSNRVSANTDWSVFVENNPTECWSVSSPKETVNTKNGRAVAVKRSDILLFVSYRPSSNVKGEVSFTGGYPFAPGSTVDLAIGSNSYQLFTDGEWAWAASPADDAKIITSMKAEPMRFCRRNPRAAPRRRTHSACWASPLPWTKPENAAPTKPDPNRAICHAGVKTFA